MNKIRVTVLKDFDGHKAGTEIVVPCDSEGTPLELSWRRRMKDAAVDGCCKVVKKQRRHSTNN